jgi:ubiquinone/menaquinone biosynthesis C-methylase UbiE
MKMNKLEKYFVNSSGHSESVSHRAEHLLNYAQPAPGKRYLDVGTGNGAVAVHMARTHQMDVIGVDVDPEQIQLAQAAAKGVSNVRFQTLDGRALPFDDGSFDIVSAFKVTHHIPNWQDALAEMLRVVKPGGYFVYADLLLPPRLAAIGERWIRSVGFPTAEGLTNIAAEQDYSLVYKSQALVLVDAVYCKHAN